MRMAVAKKLFPWEELEDSPSLETVRDFLAGLPDGKLLAGLEAWRGRGRDDYPIPCLWGAVVLTPLLRHTSFAATLGELRRNGALRLLIGIEREDKVPKDYNLSRFLAVLGRQPHLGRLHEMFDGMVQGLGQAVPELGRQAAGDATGLSARPGRAEKGNPDKLPEPAGGRKEYKDAEGKVTKVIEWFGYKLHLVVDVPNEVALAYRVTEPSAGDNEVLPETLRQAAANLRPDEPAALPPDAQGQPARGRKRTQRPAPCRIETLAFDMAADDEKVHDLLALQGIKPLIENRSLWKEDFERMLPGHDGRSNVVYDEAGTVYCYDKASDPPVRHPMAYIGHEPARGTVKYRCPAMHGQWTCPSHSRCNAGKKYGKTVRVKCELDPRRFPPIPRATKQFERLYKGRTAVERVNGRLKVFWGANDGNVTGPERFHAHVGVVMVVHIGLATLLARASGRKGTLGTMRLTTVAQAIHGKPRVARGG